MRSTVLFFDTLIYLPALLMFIHVWHGSRSSRSQVKISHPTIYLPALAHTDATRNSQHYALLVLLLQPALLLVDFGHFQYNSVMLGTFGRSSLVLTPFTFSDLHLHRLCALCSQLFCHRTGSNRRSFLCAQSGFQTNGTVLRASHRIVSN